MCIPAPGAGGGVFGRGRHGGKATDGPSRFGATAAKVAGIEGKAEVERVRYYRRLCLARQRYRFGWGRAKAWRECRPRLARRLS